MSGKKRHRHSPQQIVRKLAEADRLLNAGQSLGQVLQTLSVSQATYHRWRQQYGGMKASHYNHRRPHSSLNYQPPARFAASLGVPPRQLGAAPLVAAPPRPAIESANNPPTLIEAGT